MRIIQWEPVAKQRNNESLDRGDVLTNVLASIGAGLALLVFLFYIAFAIAFIVRMETID